MLIDTILSSIRNLGRKKFRSALTIAGIAIGVASVVLIASIGDIGKYSINDELNSLGIGSLMISGNKMDVSTQLNANHLKQIRQSGGVESAIPIMVEYTKTYMRGLMADTVVWGIDSGANQVISMESLHGRLLNDNDVLNKKRVCVIDQNVAQAFYKRENIVGKKLRLQFMTGYTEFEIIGVVSSGGNIMQGLLGDYIPSFIYIPYTTLQEISGKNMFDQIAVRVKDGIDGDMVGNQLVAAINRSSGVINGFKSENMLSQKDKLNRILDIFTCALSAIAGVSLVVAGLGIMTIMLVSVYERTNEIGIKKSIGASRRNILFEFLIEAFVISAVGSLIGAAFGMLIVIAGCLPLGITPRINVDLVLICIGISVTIGVVFGVYPASVASRMKPVDALRRE